MNCLPKFYWHDLCKKALYEDLGLGGDITCQALDIDKQILTSHFKTREKGVLCGLPALKQICGLLDPNIKLTFHKNEGDLLQKGDVIANITGPAAALLAGERTALNILCHLSGIASETHSIAQKLKGTKTKIAATRKTLPGLRAFQKYAVKIGGGLSHRFRLDDAILIKDNHIALFKNDIAKLLKTLRQKVGHMTKIEMEIDHINQLKQALPFNIIDIYLLDNMSHQQLKEAVALIDGKALTEASGGITPKTAHNIALTGVDVISLGWLTQNVTPLDIGLDSII